MLAHSFIHSNRVHGVFPSNEPRQNNNFTKITLLIVHDSSIEELYVNKLKERRKNKHHQTINRKMSVSI